MDVLAIVVSFALFAIGVILVFFGERSDERAGGVMIAIMSLLFLAMIIFGPCPNT